MVLKQRILTGSRPRVRMICHICTRPNIQLNAFASNLSTATNADQVVVAYTLNADAKNAAINFYAGGELKYSHVLKGSDLMAGGHEVAIDNSLLGVPAGTQMTYELDVTALGITAPTKVGDGYKVYSAYGLAINNVPASKGFGQLYVAESRPLNDANGTISEPSSLSMLRMAHQASMVASTLRVTRTY